MKLTWLGHAGIRLQFGSSVVLVDPFITGAGRPQADLDKASAGCTHLLLTHGHDDHIGDTVAICKATGAQLVANPEVCGWLSGQGVEKVNPGNHGGTIECGDFSVSFVQALHSSSTTKDGVPVYLGNPNGLVVTPKSGPVVYHMGDTDIFGDMALIEEQYRPKVGIVPVGDRFTMGPRNAAMACRKFFHFETIVPVHFGTFPILQPTAEPFVAAMGDAASTVKVLKVGEETEV